MTEENKEEVKKEEPKVEPELSEVEQKAVSMGWKPEDQLPQGVEFIPADEFVRRKPLFDKIESQKRFYDEKIHNVERTLDQLAQHHARVKEMEYNRAFRDLQLQKRAALKEGDTAVALELEDKMDSLVEARREEIKEPIITRPEQPKESPEFLAWVKYNQWYLNDPDMHDFADGTAAAFVNRIKANGQQIDEQKVFSHVLDKVQKAYPEKFENPNRNLPGKVSSGTVGGKTKKSDFKLTEEQEDIARNFDRSGVMTRKQYIEELEQMHERGEI